MHLNAFPHRINFDQKKHSLLYTFVLRTYIKVYVRVDVCVFDPKIISYCPLWDSILNRTLLSTHSSELMPNAQHILILNCVPFDFEVETTTKYLLLACVSVSNYQNSKSLLVHCKRLLPYSLEKAMNQDNQVIWHLLSTFIHLAFAPFANSVCVCIIISMQIPLTTTTSIWLCSRWSVCQNTSMTSIIVVVEF